MRNNTPRGDAAQMLTPAAEPFRTVTTKGHQSLVVPYYGHGNATPVARPLGTVTTRDRHALVEGDALVDDCGFRMLEPHEVAAAMAFPTGYIPTALTKRDRVRLAGNAVTPPVMAWLCRTPRPRPRAGRMSDFDRDELLAAGRATAANFRSVGLDPAGLDEWAASLLALDPHTYLDRLADTSARSGLSVDVLDDCVQAGRNHVGLDDWAF
jgi:hypothetical protein